MESRFTLSHSCWLGQRAQDLLFEFQSGVFPSLPMSHLFIKYAAYFTSVGRDSGPNAVLQHSLQCSSLTSHESHSTFDDPRWTPTGGLSGTVSLPSWRACAISLANASVASSLSHLSVTLLCPSCIHVVFHSAHPIAVLRFQFAWTCLPRSLLLPSKSWVAAVERNSFPLLSSICNLIDCVWACT